MRNMKINLIVPLDEKYLVCSLYSLSRDNMTIPAINIVHSMYNILKQMKQNPAYRQM